MVDTITIDRTEYERLREAEADLADLLRYDRANAAIDAGDDELVSSAIAARLVAGESPLRVYRDLRDMTQAQLAERSGVNRVQIADIEAGRKSGSVDTLRKLANALGIMIDDLV